MYRNIMLKTSTQTSTKFNSVTVRNVVSVFNELGRESNARRIWGGWVTVQSAGMLLTRPCCCVPHRSHVAVSPRSRGASLIHWSASRTPLAAIGGVTLSPPIVSPPRLKRWTRIRRRREEGEPPASGCASHTQDEKPVGNYSHAPHAQVRIT